MAYQRKTTDIWVVQGFYSSAYGWEDVTAEEKYRDIRERLKEYRANEPGTSFRIVVKREKKAEMSV